VQASSSSGSSKVQGSCSSSKVQGSCSSSKVQASSSSSSPLLQVPPQRWKNCY
jgi:hypothetical protein